MCLLNVYIWLFYIHELVQNLWNLLEGKAHRTDRIVGCVAPDSAISHFLFPLERFKGNRLDSVNEVYSWVGKPSTTVVGLAVLMFSSAYLVIGAEPTGDSSSYVSS